MELDRIREQLITEIGLEPLQAEIYLLVVCNGSMSVSKIADKTDIDLDTARRVVLNLVDIGAFIDMPEDKFESMHPRFTAVNMYRRMCKRQGLAFGRNKIVDSIGALLEPYYDYARTK